MKSRMWAFGWSLSIGLSFERPNRLGSAETKCVASELSVLFYNWEDVDNVLRIAFIDIDVDALGR